MRVTSAGQFRGVLTLAALGALALSPARASLPDRSWLGVKRLAVVTEVRESLRPSTLTADLCARIKRIAQRGAPVPVECVEADDAALGAGGTVVLIAQAAIEEFGRDRVLVFTTRKDRDGGLDPQPVLLGAAPRAVKLTGSAADEAALDRALVASLGEVLSWLRPAEVEQMTPIKQERVNGI